MTVQTSPFLFVDGPDLSEVAGRTDVLVFQEYQQDGHIVVSFPQFDLEACAPHDAATEPTADEVAPLLRDLINQAMRLFEALTELPPAYVNQVEEAQLTVFTRVLFPFLARTVVDNPQVSSDILRSAKGASLV